MPLTENALPDDIDALKAMVLAHATLIAQRFDEKRKQLRLDEQLQLPCYLVKLTCT